jgi:hypothetical protein
MLNHHWNEAAHFNRGIEDPVNALDASSWGLYSSYLLVKKKKTRSCLAFVEYNFRNTQVITGKEQTVTGYAPYDGKDVIWVEVHRGVQWLIIVCMTASDGIVEEI